MEFFITVTTLVCIIAYQGWLLYDQRKQFNFIEDKLLNRIMAKDYTQLVQGDIAHKQVDREMTAEEIAEMYAERGIPV
jgi:hypothetical protein